MLFTWHVCGESSKCQVYPNKHFTYTGIYQGGLGKDPWVQVGKNHLHIANFKMFELLLIIS